MDSHHQSLRHCCGRYLRAYVVHIRVQLPFWRKLCLSLPRPPHHKQPSTRLAELLRHQTLGLCQRVRMYASWDCENMIMNECHSVRQMHLWLSCTEFHGALAAAHHVEAWRSITQRTATSTLTRAVCAFSVTCRGRND